MNRSSEWSFETHITLDAERLESMEAARAWAARSGLKWTQIELSQGSHPIQPMLTFWGSGTLSDQIERAKSVTRQLTEWGADVVRVKVETETASISSDPSIPETAITPSTYFESHFKLRLNTPAEQQLAVEIALSQQLHLSRNARRSFQDSSQERFLTLRSYNCTLKEAATREQRALRAIQSVGLRLLEKESEWVVYDSNLDLDAGWDNSNV